MDYIRDMLEFKIIIDQLKGYAVSRYAKDKLDQLEPILEERKLLGKLEDVSAAREMLDMYGAPPLGNTDGILIFMENAVKGQILTIEELEIIERFAALSSRLKRYLKKGEDFSNAIAYSGSAIYTLEHLRGEIERCIRGGAVDDYASTELKNIRKKIVQTEYDIRVKLESILKGNKKYFADSFSTSRDGAYAVPVKKEYRSQIKGHVVGTSSTGATVFIEPAAVTKLREELDGLKISEYNEVQRILSILTNEVVEDHDSIINNLHYMEELDVVFAKAKLSYDIKGRCPKINTNRLLYLKNAKHPLIPQDTCIPLNIRFGDDYQGVVITGPNTGGKTVALKTVGLLSVMAQCGLHIPCEEADICMNSKVLCDIGDHQSISQNLSTFSAHIKNVIKIVDQLDHETLVLMDELGSGTDPSEGMGIAIAILDELRISGCNFVVTTHYPEVKEYTDQCDTLTNARMAFDKESLSPLYTLEMGAAGESCAIYIAKRLGMSENMLKKAEQATSHKINTKETQEKSMFFKEDQDIKILKKEKNRRKSSIIRQKNQKEERRSEYIMGDSVIISPDSEIGIVYQEENDKGEVCVQIKKEKHMINYKRLKLKASAKDLYPEDYDFSIIFDSVENRKARHLMGKRHQEGNTINYDDLE